jgi:hypothetical protein
MICPYCNNTTCVKNGHAPSSKPRWKCKSCKRTFDENTRKKYPPTKIPFPFIAVVLHNTKNQSFKRTLQFGNFLLQFFKLYRLTLYSNYKIPYSTLYYWKKKYGPIYNQLITLDEINDYYKSILQKGIRSELIRKPYYDRPFIKEYKIKRKKEYFHMDTLRFFHEF